MKIYIPIKHNSQRVPGKNFREFAGKALWEHTIDKLSNFRVYVDTDSDEIIESCEKKSWVTSYKRPEELRGDKVSVVDLLKNFVKTYCDTNEPICQVHVTSPFLYPNHLHKVKHMFETEKYDSIFSTDVIQNRFWRNEEYGLVPVNHNPMKLEQTQDLPKYYMENSYLYAFKPEVLEFGNRIGKNPYILEVGFPFNLDIDTEQDWEIVKLLENYEW
jgi:CMP-N-acetylneuraminic acid synthetase